MTDPTEAATIDGKCDETLALLPLAKSIEPIQAIADLIGIDVTAEAGNLRAMKRKVINHMNSDEFDNNTDRSNLANGAWGMIRDHLGFQADDTPHKVHQPPPLESGNIKRDTGNDTDSDSENENANEKFYDARSNRVSGHTRGMAAGPGATGGIRVERLKDFKLNGSIGTPGEKGKLTYGSLVHQVNSGMERGFPEPEICAAVIRAITPGNTVRIYLEGKRNLTLDELLETIESYFCEKNVTSVYNKMTRAVQGTGPKDTPMTFVIEMFSLRDQVLELSRQDKGHRYSRKLVQAEMQKSIYNGIRDNELRRDLKHLLMRTKDVQDRELLKEISQAVIGQEEREAKMLEGDSSRRHGSKGSGSSSASVSLVGAHGNQNSPDNHNMYNNPPNNNDNQQQQQNHASNNNYSNNHYNSNNNNFHNDKNTNQNRGTNNNTNQNTNSKNNTNTSSSPAPNQNMDPFLAQMSMVIGSQLRTVVDPLQAQVSELMGFKKAYERATNGDDSAEGRDGQKANMSPAAAPYVAPPMVSVQPPDPASINSLNNRGTDRNSTGGGTAGSASQPQIGDVTDFQKFLNEAFRNYRDGGNDGGRGGGQTGGPQSGNWRSGNYGGQQGGQGGPGGQKPKPHCRRCLATNAQWCFHCYKCYSDNHKLGDCPHLNDPNFVPKN